MEKIVLLLSTKWLHITWLLDFLTAPNDISLLRLVFLKIRSRSANAKEGRAKCKKYTLKQNNGKKVGRFLKEGMLANLKKKIAK